MHVIPWPGGEIGVPFSSRGGGGFPRFARGENAGRKVEARLRTRDDPWIPTSERVEQTGETQWPREDAAASMPSSSSLARTARGGMRFISY